VGYEPGINFLTLAQKCGKQPQKATIKPLKYLWIARLPQSI